MTNKMTVYLAGPIDNVSGEESSGWREKVKEALPGINFLDPLDRKYNGFDYDIGEWTTGDASDVFTEIVESDKTDVKNSDAILVCITTDQALEQAWKSFMRMVRESMF